MSDTSRPTAEGGYVSQAMADVGRTTIDTAEQAVNTVAGQTEEAARIASDVTQTATESAERSAAVAADVVGRGRDAAIAGARMTAAVNLRIADASYHRGQHIITSGVRASEVYRDAAERSADRMQALFNAGMTLVQGAQQMQQTWLSMLGQTVQSASHKPADMLRCNNIVELAEVQREFCLEAVSHAFDTSSRLLEIASRTALDAARPLQANRN